MKRTLVERAQRGDREAYERLAEEAARPLFRLAVRILRDPDLAEDAVQQTLVAIWRDLPSLRDPDRFDAWTYRTLVRNCHNQDRRERRMGVTVVQLAETTPARSSGIDEVDLRDQLERSFAALSQDHRTVIVLSHYLGLTNAEIAEILDIPYGTVGSRLHQAMRSMRAAIEADSRTPIAGGQPA